MKTGFSLDYPWWFIFFCICTGAIYSVVLYYRNPLFSSPTPYQSWLNRAMSLLRFSTVSVLSFLLLSPIFKHFQSSIEKPIIVFLHDVSASVALGFNKIDSITYHNNLKIIKEKLSKDYEVKSYSFGNKLLKNDILTYIQPATNMDEALNSIYNMYDNQNVGALVLATDGLYNQGNNPLYCKKPYASIYTIALGDTIIRKDIKVENVFHNKIVYLGDKISINAELLAWQCQGENATATLSQLNDGGKVISKQNFAINKGYFRYTGTYTIEASKVGTHHYRLALRPLDGEITTGNNIKDFFIEVVDEKQKVLLLANAPHPDIAALKNSIESIRNYEVEVAYIKKFTASIKDYNLVILHNLPSNPYPIATILSQLKKDKISTLFILGTQTNISAFNNAQNTLKINGNKNNTNEVTANIVAGFNLFTTEQAELNNITDLPALLSPYGEYQVMGSSKTLFTQKIGNVTTKYPLITFNDDNNSKIGIIAGENFWRWRMYEFMKANKHNITDNLFTKCITYLSVKQNRKPFKVTISKNNYLINEIIHLDAELYNESMELINTPEVALRINDNGMNEKRYTFNKNANSYYLDAGQFEEGSYNYTAITEWAGKQYSASGSFNVSAVQLELLETQANHQMLYTLSKQHNGAMLYPEQVSQLADSITLNRQIKPVLYNNFTSSSIMNWKWIFFLLMGCLSLEWFVRKWSGGY